MRRRSGAGVTPRPTQEHAWEGGVDHDHDVAGNRQAGRRPLGGKKVCLLEERSARRCDGARVGLARARANRRPAFGAAIRRRQLLTFAGVPLLVLVPLRGPRAPFRPPLRVARWG